MAHFAQIDNNIVTLVIVVNDNDILIDGRESEQRGIDFCKSILGGQWVQTSYNGKFRKNYAGIGYTYDQERDAFISPKPFPSWVLDETSCRWIAPIAEPIDDKRYYWSEELQSWVIMQ